MTTKQSQTKYWSKKNTLQIESYLKSPIGIARSKWFAEHLRSYEFESICEAGTFAGRNLVYIHDVFPDKIISGFDINNSAVKFAKNIVKGSDIWQMDIYDIKNMDREFDIIFTSGTMIHLIPDTIPDVIKGLVVKAKKYIMHIEECGGGEVIKGPKHMDPIKKVSDQLQFAPDLVSCYNDIGYSPKVVELFDEHKTNGASELIVVKL